MSSYDDRWHGRIDEMVEAHHTTLHGNGGPGLMATVSSLTDWRDKQAQAAKERHSTKILIICALIGVFGLAVTSLYDHISAHIQPQIIYVDRQSQTYTTSPSGAQTETYTNTQSQQSSQKK